MKRTLTVFSILLILTAVGCNRPQASKSSSSDATNSDAHALEFTDANFETEVLQAQAPVVVMFTAPWCGPCRAQKPVLYELAGEHEGAVKIGTVNVDDSPVVSERFDVTSIPALVFFKNGKEINRFIGVQTKDTLQAAIAAAK
jgi:thioredoxin 1